MLYFYLQRIFLCMQKFSFLLLQLLSDESNFAAYKISTFDFTQFLRLDSAAVKALHLEPQPGDAANSHLSGILDNCSSPQGKRLLQQWLRQPLLDRNKIGTCYMLYIFYICDLQKNGWIW